MNKIKAKLSGKKEIARSLTRLAHEIIEKNDDLSEIAIVGIRTRGDFLAKRLHSQIEKLSDSEIPIGTLDVTFHRDDFLNPFDWINFLAFKFQGFYGKQSFGLGKIYTKGNNYQHAQERHYNLHPKHKCSS